MGHQYGQESTMLKVKRYLWCVEVLRNLAMCRILGFFVGVLYVTKDRRFCELEWSFVIYWIPTWKSNYKRIKAPTSTIKEPWFVVRICTYRFSYGFSLYWILHTYVRRVYHGHIHSPTRQELQEPNHPRDVIGSHRGISVDSLLVQRIWSL